MKKMLQTGMGLSLLLSTQAFAEGQPAGKEGGIPQTFLIMGFALVLFYFILWRPEQKRRKQTEEQRSSMKVGDKVTAMGIIGVVSKIEDKTVVLKMYDGSQIEVLKVCITEVQSKGESA